MSKKQDNVDKVVNYYQNELKRNYVKALSQGYCLALNDLISMSESDTDLVEWCKKELGLRKNFDKGVDGIYDKKEKKNET